MENENAYQYSRVSGKGQLLKDGFDRQRDVCNFYASQHNISIINEFIEKGISGTTDSYDRPALTALFAACLSNGVKLILIETPSRLARDLMVSEILLAECRKLGIRVISAECGTELTVSNDADVTKTLIRQILGAVSQWQKSMLVAQLRMARIRIRKSGKKCEGQPVFGQNERERAVISRIVNLNASGVKPATIATILNADGIKPRKAQRAGKEAKFHPVMIYRILERHTASSQIAA